MALDDYKKTLWAPTMPITEDRMNKLEEGVYVNREVLQSLNNTVTTQGNAITTLNTNVDTKLNQEQVDNRIILQLSGISQDSEMGRNAWTAIANATTSANPTPYGSLTERFTANETLIANLRAALGQIKNTDTNKIEDIYTSNNTVANALINLNSTVGAINEEIGASLGRHPDTGVPNTQFRQHMNQIDEAINTLKNSMNTIFDSTGVDDNNQRIALSVRMAQLIALDAEVQAAHREITGNADPDTLAKRFHDIEVDIGRLRDSKVNIDDIVDELDRTDTKRPLSANMGKMLNDTIGGTYSPTNTVASAIAKAQSTAEEYADNNKIDKTKIYNGLDYETTEQNVTKHSVLDAAQGKVLKDLIDSNDITYKEADTTLGNRLTAIETEISDARPQVGTDEESGEPIYGTLDNRLDSIESTATQIRNDINTIAGELAMVDETTNSIKDTNTKIDDLTTDVHALAEEIAMGQDENGRLIGAETRIDDIEDEIDAAHRAVEEGEPADTLNARFTDLEAKISHPAENEDAGGLTERLTSLEEEVRHESTGLAATKAIADANAAAISHAVGANGQDDKGGLIERVTILEREPKSATEVVTTLPQTGDETKDYLVGPNDDGKYFYYKWINNDWHLISGGSGNGSGNSSGFIYNAADYDRLESTAENTDYYVLRADGYHHYRWVDGNEIEIDEPTKHYNIALETVTSESGNINYLNFYEFNPGISNIITDDTDLATIEQNRIHRILLPATGSGSGTANNLRIYQITARNVYNAYNSNLPIKLRFFFTTGEAGEGASYTVAINGQNVSTSAVNITSGDPKDKSYTWPVNEKNQELSVEEAAALGFYEVDVSEYCKEIATYNIKLTIALDSNAAITSECNWTVQTINLSIVSNYTNNPIAQLGATVPFTFIPTGNIEKIVHIKIDGTEIGTATIAARTNTTQTYNIPAQPAGAHKLEAYLTANNGALKSGSVYRDIIWYDASSSDIILASPYRNNTERISQYDSITIPYTVVGGNTGVYEVKYYVDDLENSINEVTLNNTNAGSWTYQALTAGTHTLMIKVGTATLTFTVIAKSLDIDITQVTNNLAIDFNPTGISNTSSKRLWTNGTYSLSVSDNFDWYNGGYGSDVNGDYFLVKAGTRAIFNYKMFKSYTRELNGAMTTSSTVFRDGAEMKIIFKTSAVRNAEATWFTNMGPNNSTSAAKNVGIQLNVHNGWLRTDSADATNVKSYLYFPYSEEDRIELDININPETATNAVYCMSYEDGCPSRAYPYKATEGLYQIADNESNIIIGSDDCDVYIYRFKIYNTALDTEEVLRNFIADGKDTATCIERYNRNSIYYDTQLEEYTPYEGVDTVLDPERLAIKLPDVKILMLDAPIFTKSKKDFIKDSSLRCIHAPGGKVYPSRGKEDNWFFGNGYHAGQGTTSDKYGDAGRNVDFLFNCDGVHNPSDKVKGEAFVPGYQSYVIKGYGTDEQEEPEYCTDWKGDSGKVSLTATSIPNNFFNMKVNIASSENVNNALFQKRYNDFLLYQSPAFLRDNRIKNDMEFVPAILFVRENKVDEQGNPDGHREFADTNWHFYALGNIGDSKKTDYTRAYDPTDINEFALEISDNNTNNSQFQTGVYMKNGVRTIEPYTVVDDVDDDGELTGTKSAKSSEEDITLETTAYLYPIDKETEWEAVDEQGNPKNMRYWGLMNEKFDGEHSFEMRYAYLGNYRDGKLVNGDKTTANEILERNSNVWRAFYTWLVTSSDQEIQNEIDQWCVRRSMAFFFAFTHYYTMIDNRAKNTFWHFAKTGKHRRVSRPVPELLHVYEVADGEVTESELEPGVWVGKFKAPENTSTITTGVTYYTQYAFDMWAYDMDTAAGIDNNGELIFPYGKEDTDDRVDGDPTSGKVFNGAGSVFWARLRDNFTSDITSTFTSADASCFNADNLIAEFDKVQNCYPEAIWRLDVERKYIRSFTGDDGATEDHPEPIYLTRKNTRFLGDMMQGRKKYQRRQWIKDQGVYFGSKYKMLNVMDNQFDMVCYTIANQNVMANWDLTITPYQDMYINVEYAETPIAPIRAKANVPVEIDCPFTSMNESRVRIYGADYIRALAGKPIKNEQGQITGANSLASFYFRGNDFSHTNKLRELYIGSSDSTYTNGQFVTLNLNENSPILEVLDLQNCNGLSGTLDVSGCTSLKTLNIQGTSYSSVNLPSSTGITNLYLPDTINRLVLTAAKNLTNLTIRARGSKVDSVDNLTELIIADSDYSNKINWMSIAAKALSHLTNIQLLNLRLASIGNINEMNSFVERKEQLGNFIDSNNNNVSKVNLTGEINVTGDWSEVEKRKYQTVWKNLQFNTNAEKEKIKCAVNYYNTGYLDDNEGEIPNRLITTIFVDAEGDNSTIPDIYADADDSNLPKRNATKAYTYSFGSYDENDNYIPYSGWTLNPNPDFGDPIPLSNEYDINNNPFQPPAGTSEIFLYTFFYAIKHKYKVQWKVEDKVKNITKIIKETNTNQEYGGGYSLVAPTIMDIRAANIETNKITDNHDGTFTYEIIEGWEKLPINIDPTKDEATTSIYTINAKWSEPETKTLAEFFEDTSELTAKQLAILSKLNQSTINSNDNIKKIIATRKFNYTMGYEGAQSGGIELGVKRVSKTTSSLPTFEVNPFAPPKPGQEDKGFTLVIDYQFGEVNNGTSPEVLVGCYDKDASGSSICSFALYRGYNATNGGAGTFVCFGVTPYSTDTTKRRAVGDAIHRNTIVLRREKNTSTLRIYTGLDAASTTSLNTTLQDNIAIELGTLNTSENAVICIGALRADLSTNSLFSNENNNTKRALGTVYWMKYWDEDIGLGECLQLAAWPRENMTAIITAVNTTTNRPKLYFTNLNCSNHSMVTNNTFTVPNANDPGPYSTGWLSSNTKAIYDTRVVRGLPVELQAIIKKPSIGYYNYVAQYSGGSTNVGLSDLRSIESYVYAPSVSSLDLSYTGVGQNEFGLESIFELTGSTDSNTSAITPYQWMRAPDGVINAQRYAGGGTDMPWATVTPEAYWFNIRFNEKPISWSTTNPMNVYIIDSSTIGSSTFYDAIGGTNIKSGDIVIYRTITSGETQLYGVYMYVTTAESSTLGLLTMPNEGYWSTSADGRTYGGWIESTPYITRSVSIGGGRQPNYAFVDKQGGLHFPTLTNDQAAAGSLSLDFAFTI